MGWKISQSLENLINKLIDDRVKNKIIYDSGSNYIRYNDGTMICYGTSELKDCAPVTATIFQINLPQSFINNSYVITLSRRNGGNNYTSAQERTVDINQTFFKIYSWNISQQTASALQYDYIAIGRWK